MAGTDPGCQHGMSKLPDDHSVAGIKREGLAEVAPHMDAGKSWLLSVAFINTGNETYN